MEKKNADRWAASSQLDHQRLRKLAVWPSGIRTDREGWPGNSSSRGRAAGWSRWSSFRSGLRSTAMAR